MGVKASKFAAVSLAAVIAASGLAGCAEEATTVSPSSAPTVEPSSEPTEEPTEEPTADVLVNITANVRAADGRTIGVSMAVHAPLASTDSKAAALREKLLGVCGAGNGIRPITEEYLRDVGSTLLGISIASSAPDLTFETPIELLFGSPYYAQAATGGGITPDTDGVACFSGFMWAQSGTVEGVADFENPDGTPDLNQWKTGLYGFFVKPSSGATIEACKATITDLGLKENITNLPGWDTSRSGDGISCKIGYTGE